MSLPPQSTKLASVDSGKGDGKKLEKIKSSAFSRGLSLAKMTLNTGAGLAGHRVSTLFASDAKKDENWKAFLLSRAKFLTNELGELKGSLMKAGQMLSMYGEHFLPPEANQLLKSLQADSPSLKWSAMEPLFRQELGAKYDELEIEHEPIGSASLGQVHRAKVKATGEVLALKLQYPGVDRAIDSDLKALKSFFNMMKFLPQGRVTDHIFEEIRVMLEQETDYPSEMDATEKYAALLAGDSRYVVPKVNRNYSGKKLIATSFERGVRADDPVIKNLAPDRRNRLALMYMELYYKELFDWGVVQTDPHLGNYRIRLNPDGKDQFVLFDFGAVREYPESFLKPYHDMIEASLKNDKVALREAALKLRFLQAEDDPELTQIFEDFCTMTVEPFLEPSDPRNDAGQIAADGTYDWKNSDLPQRLTKKVFEMIRRFELRPPPGEILFLDRKTGGVFVFMSVFGAKIRARELLLEYLAKRK